MNAILFSAFSLILAAPLASADPSCSDYPAFLRCVKQKQGTWQDCREWHCEGGTSRGANELLQDAQARDCTVGPCETVGLERNSPNCQANSVPRPAYLVRILVDGEYHRARLCGGRDCQIVREGLAKKHGCRLE